VSGQVMGGPLAVVGTTRTCKVCDRDYVVPNRFRVYVCEECHTRVTAPDYKPVPELPLIEQDIGKRLDEIDAKLGHFGGRLDPTIRIPIQGATWDYYKTPPWGTEASPDENYYLAHGYLREWPQPKLLVLLGDVGRGKTYLAALIAKEVALKGAMIQFLRWQRLVERWKSAEDWGEFARRQIEPSKGADLLIIDEIGRESMTDNERIRFETILDERYERRLPTILASNLSRPGFEGHVQPMIWSRIEEWSNGGREIYELPGPDRRKRMEAVK
jgi:hypothetical protein